MSARDDQEVPSSAIAILGMSGRFPGAGSVEELWAHALAGEVGIERLSEATYEAHPFFPAPFGDRPGFVPVAAAVADAHAFDAPFFGLAVGEARQLDVQLRLLLECAWEALERAGIDPLAFRGRIALYVGAANEEHRMLTTLGGLGDPGSAIARWAEGTTATQLAWRLGLRGEAVDIDTTCSTGLVAVHLASQSLLLGHCDVAIAAAAQVRPFQHAGYVHADGLGVADDGVPRPFDVEAHGTVHGNGVAAFVLKPFDAAVEDGDPIEAVVRASALNNDGAGRTSFTTPGVAGQSAVIREALALAEVDPAQIGYVEAHGFATPLMDAIEIAALAEAHGHATPPCDLGTSKSSTGHLGLASGLVGLARACCAVRDGVIPPLPGFSAPHAALRLDKTRFRIPTARAPFRSAKPGAPRIAAVSSFGIGGTNAHAIVQEAPPRASAAATSGPRLLPVSARTPGSLDRALERLATFLEAAPPASLADVAFTLSLGRRAFEHRVAVVASEPGEAAASLRREIGRTRSPVARRAADARPAATSSPAPSADLEARRAHLESLAALFVEGAAIDWRALFAGEARLKVRLPTYAFERVDCRARLDLSTLLSRIRLVAGLEEAPALPQGGTIDERIAALFARTLGREHVAPDQSFFDLGGSSLLAAQLVARLRAEVGVSLSLEDVFAHPTVEGLVGKLVARVDALGEDALGEALDRLEALSEEELAGLDDAELRALLDAAGGTEEPE